MAKQEWKPGNMLYPLPAVMVSVTDGHGQDNVFTAAWTGTVCTNPPMVSLSVRPERFSYGMIENTGEFVLNLTTRDLVFATDYCGVTSGRDVDKFQKLSLAKIPGTKVKAPLIGESPVNIECVVREKKNFGSHTMFLADVVMVHADEKYMDKNGRFDLNASDLLIYSHGEYFNLGEKLGTFGYSIRKKNQKRKKK